MKNYFFYVFSSLLIVLNISTTQLANAQAIGFAPSCRVQSTAKSVFVHTSANQVNSLLDLFPYATTEYCQKNYKGNTIEGFQLTFESISEKKTAVSILNERYGSSNVYWGL